MAKKNWEEESKSKAKAIGRRESKKAGSGEERNRISTDKRRFSVGEEMLGKTIKGVIVSFSYLRTYYEGKYKKGEGSPPSCFAVSTDRDNLAPKDVPKKQRENEQCAGCPQSKFGRGSPAPCKERRRFVIIADEDAKTSKSIKAATLYTLEISPTALKHWAKYAGDGGELETEDRFPHQVMTEFSFDPDQDYPCVMFSMAEKLSEKQIAAIEERVEEAEKLATESYEVAPAKKDEEDEDEEDDDEEDEKPKKSKSKSSDDDDEDGDEDDDEDDDDDEDENTGSRNKGRASGGKTTKRKSRVKDEDEEEEEDEDDEEDPPKKSAKRKPTKPADDDDDEEDDDDEDDGDDESDDDDDDEDDEDDERPSGKARSKGGKAGKKKKVDDDDEDEDEEEDDDEDDEPVKGRKSRFGKK